MYCLLFERLTINTLLYYTVDSIRTKLFEYILVNIELLL